jgi:hypothetical protein
LKVEKKVKDDAETLRTRRCAEGRRIGKGEEDAERRT